MRLHHAGRRCVAPALILGVYLMGCAPTRGLNTAGQERRRIRQATERGVTFLLQEQLPYGEFPLYWYEQERVEWHETGKDSRHEAGALILDSSVWGTVTILYSLRFVHDGRVPFITEKAIAFLLESMEPQGLWRYWSPRNPRYYKSRPDLDDTCLIRLSLLMNGIAVPQDPEPLLRYRTPEGLFLLFMVSPETRPTRVETQQDEILRELNRLYEQDRPDCVVNAQCLAYFAHMGTPLPEVCTWLRDLIVTGKDPTQYTRFWHLSPYGFTYAVSKAYREGAHCLADAVKPLIDLVVGGQAADGSWGQAHDTALALDTLLNVGYRGKALQTGIAYLLQQQQPDGGWPYEPSYGTKNNPQTSFGSRTITTGLVLEALGKYVMVSNEKPESGRAPWGAKGGPR